MHPDPLNQEQLAPLAITYQDFVNALPSVQPSAKREDSQLFQMSHGKTWALYSRSEWNCICV